MPASRAVVLASLLALAAPATARAQDEEPTPGQQSVGLMTIEGLSGVRTMVDARIPSQNLFRLFVRYVMDMESTRSEAKEHSAISYGSGVTVGVPLLGRIEGGFFAPLYFEKRTTDITRGQGSRVQRSGYIAGGDVGGKVGGALDWLADEAKWISLSPYVVGHISGDEGLQRLGGYNVLEAGLAEGVSFLDQQLALNANTAFVDRNSGKLAFRYRVGALFVPPFLATKDFVPRLSFYVDGLEREGRPGSSLDVAFAVQFIVWRTLLIDMNGQYRVFGGSLPAGLYDDGTGGFTASLGFRVAF